MHDDCVACGIMQTCTKASATLFRIHLNCGEKQFKKQSNIDFLYKSPIVFLVPIPDTNPVFFFPDVSLGSPQSEMM